jgi:hypothetical protein
VVFTPDARIVHHESITHGRRVPRGDFVEASRSFARLLEHGDPFFNPNLSCFNCCPSLRRDRRDTPPTPMPICSRGCRTNRSSSFPTT